MYRHHRDMMSSVRTTPRILLRMAALTAIAFALVAASVSAAPLSGNQTSSAPTADAASAKCVAKIQKSKTKLATLYEHYYKYAFKKSSHKKKHKKHKAKKATASAAKAKHKGSGSYHRVVVRAKRKIKVSCARQCARTKVVKGKRKPVYRKLRRRVTVKKGNHIVHRKKKVRWYRWQRCPRLSGNGVAGTPLEITILPGSVVHLDFGAFQRDMTLSGDLSGFVPGGFKTSADNQINLTRADIGMGATDVFIDNECNGEVSAAIRTNGQSNAILDPGKTSTSTLTADGGLTASLYTRIHLALDLRDGELGCHKGYISTGYQDIAKTFFVKGKVDAKNGGLTRIKLTSAPEPFDAEACLSPGPATSPCNGIAIPLPIIINLEVYVKIKVG